MEIDVILVTPEMASNWLSNNNANRKISPRQVAKLVHEMMSGNWRVTHQGIAFYSDGTLADGQHRLTAIVQSGNAQKMLVTTGLERGDAVGIDHHRPRNDVDTIKISHGVDWVTKDVVAVSRFLLTFRNNIVPSSTEVFRFAEWNKSHIEFANDCFTKSKRGLTASPFRAAIAVSDMNGTNRDDLKQFVDIFLTGVATSPLHEAAIRLRERCLNVKTMGQADLEDKYLCTQRALKAFVDRQRLSKLYTPTDPVWSPLADNFPA